MIQPGAVIPDRNLKAWHHESVDTLSSGKSQGPGQWLGVGVTGSIGVTAEAFQGNGYAAHRQTAADCLLPEGERPSPCSRHSADAATSWSPAPAGDESAGAVRYRGAHEEHHARTVSARASGSGGHRLRVRVRRHGPVP